MTQVKLEVPNEKGSVAPRWLIKRMTALNILVYRLSGGRLMNTLQGVPICLVTMTGVKTGKKRTIPLMYVPYKEGILLVASQGGAPVNPLWYKNLIANPEVDVEQGGRIVSLRAKELTGEEKMSAWSACDAVYAPYADYRQRTQRDIPVLYCGPR